MKVFIGESKVDYGFGHGYWFSWLLCVGRGGCFG